MPAVFLICECVGFGLAGGVLLRYYSSMIYWALGIALIIPLVFLYIIRTRDLYATGKFSYVVVTMAWGVLAYYLAANINPWIFHSGLASKATVLRIIAPIIEEILKSFLLIYLVQRADFNYVVDGALYGFGTGIGFAIVENWEYINANPDAALFVAIARVFSTNLIHATGSGVIGAALSANRAQPGIKGLLWVLGGYMFSIGLHMGFNTFVNTGGILVYAVIIGMAGLGLIYLAIRRGMDVQKGWIAEKLGDSNRVTQSEVKALGSIEESVDDLLRPIKLQFGEQKADLVKELLSVQAEIGIKTKLLDTTFNETKKREMIEIIESLRNDMESLRKEIGPYCMMFVRGVYLSHDFNMWGAIADRIAASSTGKKGGGLWDLTTSRLQGNKQDEEEEQK